MSIYANGTKIADSVKESMLIATPLYNNWHIGKTNKREGRFSTFTLDEMIFMDKKFADTEVMNLYEFYKDTEGEKKIC